LLAALAVHRLLLRERRRTADRHDGAGFGEAVAP
jgi:hypothetical protein